LIAELVAPLLQARDNLAIARYYLSAGCVDGCAGSRREIGRVSKTARVSLASKAVMFLKCYVTTLRLKEGPELKSLFHDLVFIVASG
jgi:hypothetical protein